MVAQQQAPLVLVFHGHGGTSANAARTFNTHALWPEALVVYPQGLPTRGQVTDPEGKLPGWQHVPGGEQDRDLKFVDAMLSWAKEKYQVDSSRQFVAGHSNGGSMTYVLWAARGDRFAALAPSSSVFRADVIRMAKPKPAFVVAGHQDALVPFAAQRRSLDALLTLNQAAREGQAWSGGADRHSSRVGADVVAYIHPGGHQMPANTGSLIVAFFKEIAGRPR
jgi:polyhydroxybutyrate depolymerase